MGKSILVNSAVLCARKFGIDVHIAESSTLTQHTPFHPLKKILSELLELSEDPLSNRLRIQLLMGMYIRGAIVSEISRKIPTRPE